MPEGVSFFDVLGLPVSLSIDETQLRAAFYELSRALHPDRFASASPQEAMHSTRWSTALNNAYQTLREREKRSHYLLELFHSSPEKKGAAIPLDLAEAYFELQDLLSEPEGQAQMRKFRDGLADQLTSGDAEWEDIAGAWDGEAEKKTVLTRLHQHLTKQRYLRSMISDLEKKIGSSS